MLKKLTISTKPALILDKDGKVFDLSSDFAKKLGFSPKSLLGESILNLVAEGFKPFAQKAVKSGGEFTVISRDGKFYNLRAVVGDEQISVYDLSEIPEIIRKNYSGVWDFYYGLLFVDEDRRMVAANNTFYRVTGLSEDIEGKRLDEVFDELAHFFERLLVEGEVDFSAEVNGKVFGVRAKVREIKVCGKTIYEILLRTTDEERLRNLRKTFDDIEYPVLVFVSGKLYYSNIAAEKTFLNSESIYGLISGRTAGKVEIETADGRKEYLFFKIPSIEEICIFVDLSEQNELLRRLEEELKNYKTTFESSVDAILVTDLSGKIILANSAVRFHGYSPEELIGKNAFDFILPEYAEIARRSVAEGQKKGINYKRIEIQIRDKNGKPRWVEVVGSAIRNEKGETTGAVVVLRDITAKKELEKKARESEELYRTLAESSQAGIFVIQDDKVVYMNRAAEEYVGYSREELADKYYYLFEEEARERVKKVLERVLQGNSEVVFTKYITKSGERRYADLLLVPITYKGKPAVLGNFIEVTNMVKAKKKLKEREELYRSLAENSHTGIFIIQDNKVVYGNERLREMLGYTMDEINSLEHPYMIVHPDYRDLAISRYRAREEGKKVPESYEVKVITKTGEERWVRVLASRIKYKGRPAVMVDLADITDLKENEEMLRRMNALLRVTSELSRIITHEKTEFKILSNLRTHLEKIGVKVAVFLNEDGLIPISVSEGLDEEKCRMIAHKYLNSTEITRLKEGNDEVVVLPFADFEKTYGLAIIFSDRTFTDEEVNILSTLCRDVVFSMRSLKIEREKEAALRVIIANLNQFEYLADKLRNPLAIIKGYVEVRSEFSFDEFAEKVEEQANRIESILDELRAREIATYEMKKILDRKD